MLDAVREAGIGDVIVLGHAADEIEEDRLARRAARPQPRPAPPLELAPVGIDAVAAIDPPVRAAVVVLGDQPRTRPVCIQALLAAADPATGRSSSSVRRRSPNPLVLMADAFELVDEATGDRRAGPTTGTTPTSSSRSRRRINPDIDTPDDLARLDATPFGPTTYRPGHDDRDRRGLEAAWAERVRANRDQVDRVREVPDRDFYAPVSSLFVADPRRTGEEALDALLTLAEPDDRWLDIGAGAGRYALPLAAEVGEVIAVEPSASMRNALRTGKEEHGLANVRIIASALASSRRSASRRSPRCRSSPTSATTSRRSGRSSTRWSGPRRGCASRC